MHAQLDSGDGCDGAVRVVAPLAGADRECTSRWLGELSLRCERDKVTANCERICKKTSSQEQSTLFFLCKFASHRTN